MKKLLLVGLLANLVVAPFALAQQSTTYGLGLGTGGRGSLFIGGKTGSFGYQFGIQNDLTLNPFSVSDGFPAFDTLVYGRYRTTPTYGFDGLAYFGKGETSGYLSLGLYVRTTSVIGRSPSTDLLYDLGSTIEFIAAYGIGVTQKISPGAQVGLGYHTQLGWNLNLSVARF